MKTLVAILGPTAVGKTELSLLLAERFKTHIISADSRQIFQDIAIGTAAPTAEQLARIPHHFVHTLPLDAYYSAAQYEQEALKTLDVLFQAHDTVLLAGGSQLYVDALCQGLDDLPTITPEVRDQLKAALEAQGLDALGEQLATLDPVTWQTIDRRNPRRVVHALEVCVQTGRPYSSFLRRKQKTRPFRIVKIGLTRPREELYDRINARVDLMLRDGLLDEAKRVFPLRHLNALNTVGYKELFAYLEGRCSLPDAVAKIKHNTWVYAKKQITWLQRDPAIVWFRADQIPAIQGFCLDQTT